MTKRVLGIGKLIFAGAILTVSFLLISCISLDREIEHDIRGYLGRAESAPTAEMMAQMIDNALAGLDKWGMHEGTWDLIYDTPNTRMDYARAQLEGLRERALIVENTQDQGSMGYAESLEEIKRNFDKIEIRPYGFHTLRHAVYLHPLILVPFAVISCILGPVLGVILWDCGIVPIDWVCKARGHRVVTERQWSQKEVTLCGRCKKTFSEKELEE